MGKCIREHSDLWNVSLQTSYSWVLKQLQKLWPFWYILQKDLQKALPVFLNDSGAKRSWILGNRVYLVLSSASFDRSFFGWTNHSYARTTSMQFLRRATWKCPLFSLLETQPHFPDFYFSSPCTTCFSQMWLCKSMSCLRAGVLFSLLCIPYI